jgi:hypothetical protein
VADEDTQADLFALGAADILQLPQANLDPERGVAEIKDVGGVRPGLARSFDEGAGARLGLFDVQHEAADLGGVTLRSKPRA